MASNPPIEGVAVKRLATFPDDRGYFREIYRADDPFFTGIRQTSVTETYPGVIKAFHWHKLQDDVWYVHRGTAQVVLYDQRSDSPTKSATQVVYAGEQSPCLIFIPRGVAHGYRVIGNERVVLFYHTTEAYNPTAPDEYRIPFNDPSIAFDWTTKNR